MRPKAAARLAGRSRSAQKDSATVTDDTALRKTCGQAGQAVEAGEAAAGSFLPARRGAVASCRRRAATAAMM